MTHNKHGVLSDAKQTWGRISLSLFYRDLAGAIVCVAIVFGGLWGWG